MKPWYFGFQPFRVLDYFIGMSEKPAWAMWALWAYTLWEIFHGLGMIQYSRPLSGFGSILAMVILGSAFTSSLKLNLGVPGLFKFFYFSSLKKFEMSSKELKAVSHSHLNKIHFWQTQKNRLRDFFQPKVFSFCSMASWRLSKIRKKFWVCLKILLYPYQGSRH